MRKIGWAITVVWLTSGAALAQTARDPRALATYEEGKRLYDRGEYAAALRHFDGAAEIEPGVARWQYNRGLALRKLKRAAEAREALLKSRSLDPAYKRAEIDKRLSELGGLPPATDRPVQVEADSPAPNSPSGETASPEPSSTGSEPDSGEDFTGYFVLAGILGAIVLFVVLAVKAGRRRAGLVAASAEGGQQRLDALANRLGGVERAFAAGEDPEARAWVEKATRAEQLAGKLLPRAKLKPKKLPDLEAALSEAEHSAEEAEQRLKARFGPELTLAKAERAGCYFCARPLPNPESRIQVSVKQGAESFPAAVCSDCAAQAEAGEPPRVTVVDVM